MKNCKLLLRFRALSRKRKIGLTCLAVVLAICAGMLYNFPVYRVGLTCGDKYFDRKDLALLCFRGTPGDRRAAEKILDQARTVFEDRETTCAIYGENDPRRAKYGALWRHVTGPDAAESSYSLKLLSAHLGVNEGKIWIQYSHKVIDEKGVYLKSIQEEVELWTVQRIDGTWKVVSARWEV